MSPWHRLSVAIKAWGKCVQTSVGGAFLEDVRTRSASLPAAARRRVALPEIDLNEIILEVTEAVRSGASTSIQYELDLNEEPYTVSTRKDQIEQLIKLLCIYAERGIHTTGKIFVSTSHIEITPSSSGLSDSLPSGVYVSLEAEIVDFENLQVCHDEFDSASDREVHESLNAADLMAMEAIVRPYGGTVRATSELRCQRISVYVPAASGIGGSNVTDARTDIEHFQTTSSQFGDIAVSCPSQS